AGIATGIGGASLALLDADATALGADAASATLVGDDGLHAIIPSVATRTMGRTMTAYQATQPLVGSCRIAPRGMPPVTSCASSWPLDHSVRSTIARKTCSIARRTWGPSSMP